MVQALSLIVDDVCLEIGDFEALMVKFIQELEGFADPMRKEVTMVRKKIDSLDKELKPLGNTVQKKVWVFLLRIIIASYKVVSCN